MKQNGSARHYNIVKIGEKNCQIDDTKFEIQDDQIFESLESITSDVEFRKNMDKEGFYWVSGGGTFLLNDRYIFVVKRRKDSQINPFKVSLFTGRADSIEELKNPMLLARELFEELLLFSGDSLIYPQNKKFQQIIDQVYDHHFEIREDIGSKKIKIDFTDIQVSTKKVVVGKNEENMEFFINSKLDVNVLFLFSLNVDINSLSYRDGESYIKNNNVFFANRDVFLIDIKCLEYRDINNKKIKLTKENTTEHLLYFIEKISEKYEKLSI